MMTPEIEITASLGHGGKAECQSCGLVAIWFSGSGAEQQWWADRHRCGEEPEAGGPKPHMLGRPQS